MAASPHIRSPHIWVDRIGEAPLIEGPVLRVRVDAQFGWAAVAEALWTAALQAYPQWPGGLGGRAAPATPLEARLDRALEDAAARRARRPDAASPSALLRRLAQRLGSPAIVLETLHLDEAGADAASRALEGARDALGLSALWCVPPGAERLDGVKRLARIDGSGAGPPAGAEAGAVSRHGGALAKPRPEDRPRAPLERSEIWYGPIEGRPHPASPAENALHDALEEDPELRARFGYNLRVAVPSGRRPMVDVLELEGDLVVEVDGYIHHSGPVRFAADRHRDFELLAAGRRVLRLTHDEVMADVGAALDKIRAVLAARKERPTHETI